MDFQILGKQSRPIGVPLFKLGFCMHLKSHSSILNHITRRFNGNFPNPISLVNILITTHAQEKKIISQQTTQRKEKKKGETYKCTLNLSLPSAAALTHTLTLIAETGKSPYPLLSMVTVPGHQFRISVHCSPACVRPTYMRFWDGLALLIMHARPEGWWRLP